MKENKFKQKKSRFQKSTMLLSPDCFTHCILKGQMSPPRWRDGLLFTVKSICLVVLQPQARWQQSSPHSLPSPTTLHPSSWFPLWLSNVSGERGPHIRAGPCTMCSELNQCITLQGVGANTIKAQPRAAMQLITPINHSLPLNSFLPSCLSEHWRCFWDWQVLAEF